MRQVFSPATRMLAQLLQRAEDVGAGWLTGGNWELLVHTQGMVEDTGVSMVYTTVITDGSQRAQMDELHLQIQNHPPAAQAGQVRLYLYKRQGLLQDSMHHFEYALRSDLVNLAAERLSAMIRQLLVDGEFSFPHQDTWVTNDNNKTVFLRKTQGSHLIG